MANMNWPAEKTFKYEFRPNKELDLEIPLEDNSKEKVKKKIKGER